MKGQVSVVGDGTWLTAGEAAERLRVGVDAVRRALESGRLSGGKTPGGHRRVSAESVERLFQELYPDEEPPAS